MCFPLSQSSLFGFPGMRSHWLRCSHWSILLLHCSNIPNTPFLSHHQSPFWREAKQYQEHN